MNFFKNRNLFLGVFIVIFIFPFQSIYGSQSKQTDSLSYYNKLISNPYNVGNLTKAFVYFDKMKAISISERDTISAVYFAQNKSKIQYYLGDYYGSENTIVVALRLLGESKTEKAIQNKIGLYNRLGKIHNQLLDYDTAIKYYNISIDIARNQKHINVIKYNRALVYIKQKKYALAESEFQKIFNESNTLGDTLLASKALDNLGFAQFKLDKSEGLSNMLKALDLKIAVNHSMSIYDSYVHLIEYYKDKNNLDKSLFYAEKGYNIAKQVNNLSLIKEALSNLIGLTSNQDIKAYLKLSDSLAIIEKLQKNKYVKVKYDYNEKYNLAKEIQLKREREKRWKLTYLSIGVFIALMSVFVFIFQRYKYQKEKQLEVHNTETRISKKIHDEVANDVYSVLNKLQDHPEVTEEILEELDGIYARTRDISKENNTLDVDLNFESLLNDLLLGYKSNQVNVIKRSTSVIDWDKVKSYKKVAVYRVIQELLVNMKKHSKASVVVLKFSKINKKIQIFYSDNGVGCDLKKGSGIQNAENRMHTINGTIIFETERDKGFKAKITI